MSSTIEAYATLAFVIVFGIIAVWAYWPANREKFEHDARIPLDDGR